MCGFQVFTEVKTYTVVLLVMIQCGLVDMVNLSVVGTKP